MAGMLRSYELDSERGKNASPACRIAAVARMHRALAQSTYHNDKRKNGRRIKFVALLKESEITTIVKRLHKCLPEGDRDRIIEIETLTIAEYDNRGERFWYADRPPSWKFFEWAFGERANEMFDKWERDHRRPYYRLAIHIRES